MAEIRPFRAYRYDTNRVALKDVLTQPYDKITPEMQERYYAASPYNLIAIEKGKLADFFLISGDPIKNLKAIKTISMVVKDGTVYYPSEVYPKFGIQPFVAAPKIAQAAAANP